MAVVEHPLSKRRLHLNRLSREEVMAILALSALAGAICGAAFIVRQVHLRLQDHYARAWSSSARDAVRQGRLEDAISAYQTALLYAPASRDYRLHLAESLAAAHRITEAESYFRSLYDAEPGNGLLNLELARLAVQRSDYEDALRFYHGAIYGLWQSDVLAQQRTARLELVGFLLSRRAFDQAESELIALLPTMPDDVHLRLTVAEDLMATSDSRRALALYQDILRTDKDNASALAGAGRAAFKLRDYESARRHLADAMAAGNKEEEVRELASQASSVVGLDPYKRGLTSAERERRILAVFKAVGAGLQACQALTPAANSQASSLQPLLVQWKQLKDRATPSHLRRDADLREQVFDFSLEAERSYASVCRPSTPNEIALSLLAGVHRP